MSSSSSPPVVPQHCSTVSVLYELLKCEEEPCRMWLRDEMNQIPEPLINSLFHRLIMPSSLSSVVPPQSRPTVSELCELLEGEKMQLRMVLRGEMDRVVNTLFDRLTNKLRMTNLDYLDREEDGDDRAQVGNLLDQVESPTSQPSTSTFNPVVHPQHSNGDEVQLNTVEMIEIKEEVEDGEETRIIDMETLTQDRQVKREIEQEDNEMTLHNYQIGHWVKREIKEEEEDGEMVEVKEEIKEEDEEEVDGETVEVKEEDEEEEDGEAEIDDIEGWAEDNQSGDDECQALDNVPLNPTLTHPTGQSQLTVTQSADLLSPSTSTAQDETSPTALNQQATVPTQLKVINRKPQTSNRSVKRSKITIEEDEGEDGEDGEDVANEDPEEVKVKILHLNCTESNCNVKLDSMFHLHDHLSTVHRLAPLQCFADNCKSRFDNSQQISAHIKQNHYRNTRFLCSVCFKEFDSQIKACAHWYNNHINGQFKCNFVNDCVEVTDTRAKMTTHQLTKHHNQLKHFHCTHPGCTASFTFQSQLKKHQLSHLATNQFHCNWPHCSKQSKQRSNLIMHIRTRHFGLPKSMKAQNEKNIVDLRDPNEYVRVVVDE